MNLYLVVRWGIYMQGIFGVYDSIEKAEEAKEIAISLEPDSYHNFTIEPFVLNKQELCGFYA